MTAAQAAQQNNRDTSGKYQTKQHSETDVELSMHSVGFDTAIHALDLIQDSDDSGFYDDHSVSSGADGVRIFSEWDDDAPAFSMEPVDSATLRLAQEGVAEDAPEVRAGSTVLRPAGGGGAVTLTGTQPEVAADFMRSASKAHLAQAALDASENDEDDDGETAALAAALGKDTAGSVRSFSDEDHAREIIDLEEGEEIIEAICDEQTVHTADGDSSRVSLYTIATARPASSAALRTFAKFVSCTA